MRGLPICGARFPTSTPPISSTSTGIWDLPYGKGRALEQSRQWLDECNLRGMGIERPGPLDQRIPLLRVEAGTGWSTNFELEGSSFLIGPKPKTGVFIESNGNPMVFQNPRRASSAPVPYAPTGTGPVSTFRDTYPGEAGSVTLSVVRAFSASMADSPKFGTSANRRLIRFSWEVFNVTNSVRFDAANAADRPRSRGDHRLRQIQHGR